MKKIKKIQTTESELKVTVTKHLVVDINSFRFVLDEELPHWISIQRCTGNEIYEVIDEIDEDYVVKIHTLDDLKRVAVNWYFDNVEVVEKI